MPKLMVLLAVLLVNYSSLRIPMPTAWAESAQDDGGAASGLDAPVPDPPLEATDVVPPVMLEIAYEAALRAHVVGGELQNFAMTAEELELPAPISVSRDTSADTHDDAGGGESAGEPPESAVAEAVAFTIRGSCTSDTGQVEDWISRVRIAAGQVSGSLEAADGSGQTLAVTGVVSDEAISVTMTAGGSVVGEFAGSIAAEHISGTYTAGESSGSCSGEMTES